MTTHGPIIGSDHRLTGAQRACLDLVLDLIVPPSSDGRMPGAADVGVPAYLIANAPDVVPDLRDALDRLDAEARARSGAGFAALAEDVRRDLVDTMRAADPEFLRRLAQITVTCYYQHDRVLSGLGLEARAPYPEGHTVVSGDLSLLDPVRARGRIYRDA